jgi:hypothetical protein
MIIVWEIGEMKTVLDENLTAIKRLTMLGNLKMPVFI